MKTLPFCDDAEIDPDVIVQAHNALAYAMGTGQFDPFAVADSRTLKRREIGRRSIVREWEINDKLNEQIGGTDPMSLLRSLPFAFGLLNQYMCEHQEAGHSVFVV